MKTRTMPVATNNPTATLDALGELARRDAVPPEPVRFSDHYSHRTELSRAVVFRIRCFEDGHIEAHSATRAKWDRGMNPDPAQYGEGDWERVVYSPQGAG